MRGYPNTFFNRARWHKRPLSMPRRKCLSRALNRRGLALLGSWKCPRGVMVLELHFLDTHDLAQARTRREPPLECAGAPAKRKCLPHAPIHEGLAFSRHGSAARCKQGPRVAFPRHACSSVGTLGFHRIPP